MNYYVIMIRDKDTDFSRTYNIKSSRQGYAVDQALTSFLKQGGYHSQGRMADPHRTIEITVARS